MNREEEDKLKKRILYQSRMKVQDFVYDRQRQKLLWNYVKSKSDYFNLEDYEEIEDWEREELNQIRETYPELNGFEDSMILEKYDSYQHSCNQVAGYDVYREKAFLFYLICELADIVVQDPEHLFVGEYIGYYLARGKSIESSKQLALQKAISLFESDSQIQTGRSNIKQVSLQEVRDYYEQILY